jgi:glutaredoxin
MSIFVQSIRKKREMIFAAVSCDYSKNDPRADEQRNLHIKKSLI